MRTRAPLALLAVLYAALAFGAASAQALTVTVDAGGTLRIADPEGRSDHLLVDAGPWDGRASIRETRDVARQPVALEGCRTEEDRVSCVHPLRMEIDLGAGDDDLKAWSCLDQAPRHDPRWAGR